MQPDSRRMKKFGLYSCTWNDGCSMHLGPPVIQLFGSTPGSTNALAGCGGMAGAGACALREAMANAAMKAGLKACSHVRPAVVGAAFRRPVHVIMTSSCSAA